MSYIRGVRDLVTEYGPKFVSAWGHDASKAFAYGLRYLPHTVAGYGSYKTGQYLDDMVNRRLYPNRYARPGYYLGIKKYKPNKYSKKYKKNKFYKRKVY